MSVIDPPSRSPLSSLRPAPLGPSNNPEDFPTREQLRFAISLAVLTGLFGFVFSFSIFVHPINDLHFERIDRRRAEQAPPIAYTAAHDVVEDGGGGFGGVNIGEPDAPETPRTERIYPKNDVVAAAPTETPTPTPTATPIPSEDDYPSETGHPERSAPPPPSHSTVAADNVQPKTDATRHAIVGSDEAWRIARPGLFQMQGPIGPVGGGAVVDPSGLAVTCNSNLNVEGLTRIQLGGETVSGQIVARDVEHDIVLIQLSPGNYPAVVIAPEAPHAGDMLSTPAGSDPTNYFDASVATVSSGDYFRFRGSQTDSANGVAIINRRGELAGISLGRPPGFPGHSHGVGIDGPTIARLVQAHHDVGGVARPVAARVADMLFSSVPEISQRTAPSLSNGKIDPGVAMGNYQLGMTHALLDRELGPGTAVSERDGFATFDYSTPRLRVVFVRDRAVAIETEYGFYSTSVGLSPGSAADMTRMKAAVPDAILGDAKPGVGVATGVGIEVEAYQGKIARLRVVPR